MCYTSLIHVATIWLYGQVTLNITLNIEELTRIPGLRRLCKPVLQIYDIFGVDPDADLDPRIHESE